MKRYRIVAVAALVVALAALAFVSLGSARPAATTADKVTVQLKWVAQAQFAGYYAAAAKGYYKQFGLDVTIKPGGPDITPGAGRRVRPGPVRDRLAAVAPRDA